MPFDGGEFSQPRSPEPPQPPAAAPDGLRAWRAWAWTGLEALLPAEPADRGPEPLDRGAEASTTAALLRAARALIEDERAWTKGAYHTMGGKHCAVGALRAAALKAQGRYGRAVKREAHGILLGVAVRRGFEGMEWMNDNSTHAEVLAAFDTAIALAEDRRPALG